MNKNLVNKLLITIGFLFIYRLLAYVPVPGVDTAVIASFFDSHQSDALGLFNMFSGNAVERLSIISLGIMPYITASIIMELLAATFAPLGKMKKEMDVLRDELNEVNLLNAKLLYVNKIFRGKNLNENQKAKVLGAFDKATTISEVKLVFSTLSEGLTPVKSVVKENLGSASRAIGKAPIKKPILEVNDQFARWQKIAGITK